MAEAMVRGLSAGTAETSTRIQPYNVYGAQEAASTWDVARGITQAAQDGSTIINLSLGSAQDSPYLRDVIQQVSDQELWSSLQQATTEVPTRSIRRPMTPPSR